MNNLFKISFLTFCLIFSQHGHAEDTAEEVIEKAQSHASKSEKNGPVYKESRPESMGTEARYHSWLESLSPKVRAQVLERDASVRLVSNEKELSKVYKTVVKKLERGSDAKTKVSSLRQDQMKWIDERNAKCLSKKEIIEKWNCISDAAYERISFLYYEFLYNSKTKKFEL